MTRDQGRVLFLSQAIPFAGFGFMDNAIMIIAGEYIEMSIGSTLALSTMAAAGLGNLLSDIAGVGFSSKIESLTESVLKIRPPELSRAAAASYNARLVKMMGAIVGISIGCLIGMFPLLFFDADHDHNLRPGEADAKKGGGKKTISRRRRSARSSPSSVVQLDHFEAFHVATYLRAIRTRTVKYRVRAFRNRQTSNEHPRSHRKRVSFLNTSPANSVPKPLHAGGET